MCLIAVAVDAHPKWWLVLVSNRDEFHGRPTAPAGPLPGGGFGGRDERAGGGWLQVAADGRIAAVTNVRDGFAEPQARSRGALVAGFVGGTDRAAAALDALDAAAYGRFNLLLWDGDLHWASNHPAWRRRALGPGVYAVSNAALDTPWPKTERLRATLRAWLAGPGDDAGPLFAALADRATAPDADLPSTGVPLEWERRLSAAFIVGDDYGTRASTVVRVGHDGIAFEERRFGPGGVSEGHTAVWLTGR